MGGAGWQRHYVMLSLGFVIGESLSNWQKRRKSEIVGHLLHTVHYTVTVHNFMDVPLSCYFILLFYTLAQFIWRYIPQMIWLWYAVFIDIVMN